MKINWKVRLKNPWFWIGLIGVIFSPVLTALGMTAAELTTWSGVIEALKALISSPYLIGAAVTAVLSFLGIAADPTTRGLADSKQALAYTKPKKEDD